jgi:hypothetical protein
MGLAALAPAPARPPPAKAPSAARPLVNANAPKRTLAPPTCECGAGAGLSGRCAACDRVSLSPRPAGVPEPPKKIEVASAQPHPAPAKPSPEAGTLGLRSAVAAKPVAVRQTSPVRVQTQMRVSSPGDPAEQEASAVGKTIMRMPDPADEARVPPPAVSHRDTGVAHRDAAPGGDHKHADPYIEDSLRAHGSSGSPLPPDMREFMEPRFRADFRSVRIHTDDHAGKLAAQLGARAFTIGRDIYFGRGQFQPGKPEGWELVAHELTHTIQQGGAAHAPIAPPKGPPPPKPAASAAATPAKAPAGAPAAGSAAPTATPAATAPAPPRAAAPPVKPPPAKQPAPTVKPQPDAPVRAGGATAAPETKAASPAAAKAAPAAAKAAPVPAVRVTQTASRSIQRGLISEALDYIADHANDIPGFRLLTLVLGVNPINMSPVDRSAANVMRAIVELLPGGFILRMALDNAGVFEKAGAWVSDQLSTLALAGAALKQALMDFLDSLSWGDIFHPGDVWDRAKRIFTEPIDRIIDFVKGLAAGLLKLIKDAILLPLAKLAEGTRGWDLLIAVLGHNPITGDPVERSAENLIGGFLKLIGQEEIWENMKKANAIPRAWAWFQSTMSELVGFVTQIPDKFKELFESLTISDVILVVGAFRKVASVFGGFVVDFVTWAGNAVWELLKIVFQVVSPGLLEYLQKTGQALKSILKDPLPFVRNLVAAGKLGLTNFKDHFLTHLQNALIRWLTDSMKGVYIPKALTLIEFGKFALSILGVSWGQIRAKIVKALGPNGETIMQALQTGFDIVVALFQGGISAAWELIKKDLTSLKDMVVDGIVGFVTDTVIEVAIPKLVSLLIPGAGFITAIISIYDTIKFFVEKLSQIGQVVKAFVDSIVAIAGGQIAPAAQKVEDALEGALTTVISFLANFLHLGNIAKKIMEVVHKVQGYVDKALDKAVNFVVGKAKLFISKSKTAIAGLFNWGAVKSNFTDEDGESHTISVDEKGGDAQLTIASTPQPAQAFLDVFLKGQSAKYLQANAAKIQAVRTAIADANTTIKSITVGETAGKTEAQLKPLQQTLLGKNVTLSAALSALVGTDPLVGEARKHYLLEGITGTYSSIPKPSSDDLTADHQPQAAILQAAAEFNYFSDTGELATRAAGRAAEGYAINLSTTRHKAGETYGSKGKVTKQDFLDRVKPLVKGKKAADQRHVVVGELKKDMVRDADAMIGIAKPDPKSSNWDDVLPRTDDKQRVPVIKDISARIIAGEAQIKAQDFSSLEN